MKILFLYNELAQYFLSCADKLSKVPGAEVHIVRWPLNTEAPFDFSYPDNIKIYERNKFDSDTLLKLAEDISPDVIYCSGWRDDAYLKVCKKFIAKIPIVVGFDNKWTGSIKQRLASLFNGLSIKKYFSHCWIPGVPQREFAERLGFRNENILTGYYSCDFDFFQNLFLRYNDVKKNKMPHRFVYTGRYVESKGINNLWLAFIELQKENPNDWELWCLGTGEIPPFIHPKIKHFGFVQPKEMEKIISETGVFVMPSTFEPWGVAVHEFATAGFPIICSSNVGSAGVFLKESENGFMFESGNVSDLKTKLKKIISLSDDTLFNMGVKSNELAKQITPDKWVDSLISLIKGNKVNGK